MDAWAGVDRGEFAVDVSSDPLCHQRAPIPSPPGLSLPLVKSFDAQGESAAFVPLQHASALSPAWVRPLNSCLGNVPSALAEFANSAVLVGLSDPPPGLNCAMNDSFLLGSKDPMYVKTPATTAPSTPLPYFSEPGSCSPLSSPMDSSTEPDEEETKESLSVNPAHVDGTACVCADWRIPNIQERVTASSGRPVLSPVFQLGGVSDARLMIFPDTKSKTEGSQSKKKHVKAKKGACHGPLNCGLKLKVPSGEAAVRFYLTVGSSRWGPFSCDFSEHVMHGSDDLGMDWLSQIKAHVRG
jgi:hypothetical protein